ncbi:MULTISPECIES: monovalent cation/H+ antiporter subunit A [unclassified Pseudomonas]|uniref:monovalent cation/H+ antiporter subunit A n=1 Tax=unclassified Pseudomonas TaxID=196821 RepID=UPI000BDA8ADD|nr:MULTISPECIES: monovalent cation/H+ antiporter subunit A [unclassified Pseudomonas]PVZ13482.1 multicomponent K+:H+ antiporter subunit A [Pseudomonas sp. URIL14HWK12:I12]PVZ23788.1 multicomponent K+:H+ antiporter subunit A [Pseudomonas sp. URIL14HWK12:I10]PVZ33573.1 multicomponent K+:H+ antiporter subunit A [Pseudomonas sp. URIL14HWK12:I11]SNZ12061.1 multisubunit potassium/proton antiporter, PhaA subunit (TC 2.A.63.1.1)/multisubunit potassium/proton antiporter, PhaB subunit (TC 2.A.63.1.1) [Ps
MSLIALLLLPFTGAVLAALLPHNARNTQALLAGSIALAGTLQLVWWFPTIARGEIIQQTWAWLPSLGLNITLRLDGFAWLFATLVMGMGSLVSLYARYYMSPQDPVPRFFSFFLAFMGSMLGVVISGNLLQIVFFWELTSLFSFLLIGYWHHRSDARRGAYMALVTTGVGGLCLLVGILVLGQMAGSYELSELLARGQAVREHPWYPLALVLILLGALTKSAQFPFHFWLPRAMAAPTPVSAYLHSATMVKAGVFLLARLWPVLSGSDAWFWIVGGAGACTLLLGAWCAIFQHDLKSLLAYSTLSHLGLITLLLGLNSDLAAVAAVFHILNHATFKASLFMAAGIIDHESGTRDLRRLSGLRRALPYTCTLAMVASAAMAGVPLLNGFLSKEMFFAETVFIQSSPWVEYALPVIATLAGTFSVAYSLRLVCQVFFGEQAANLPRTPHEPPRWMRVPVELLVLGCLVVGIFPAWSVGPVLAVAATPVVGGSLPAYSLAIWHGVNAPLVMSLIAMVAGVGIYLLMQRRITAGQTTVPPLLGALDGQRAFDKCSAWVTLYARRVSSRLTTRRLQPQLFTLLGVVLIAAALPFGEQGLSWGDRPKIAGSGIFVVLWLIAIACALGAAWQAKYHRLAALIMVGVCGLMTCITFIWFSAPDLALTQLVVEVVTTLLILLGLRWLPRRLPEAVAAPERGARNRRLRDACLAVLVGSGMAALSYAMLTRPTPNEISGYYLTHAVPQGGGSNVVNVMLVDFRGFDTLGEITVLAVVSLTIFALLRRFRPARESITLPRQQQSAGDDLSLDLQNSRGAKDAAKGVMLVPAVLVRLLLPIAIVVACSLFMRGHNEPGGGFVAGLVVAVAFILQYMVAGTQWVEARLSLRPLRWLGAGIACATLTGAGALLWGFPFLTTHTAHLELPLLGEMHIASALFFDIGVFTVVVGSTLLILTALAHQSVRAHRQAPLPRAVAPEGVA